MNHPPRLVLFRGRGLISALIRWQTRGQYSHAAILLDDGQHIVEAWQGAGVRMKKITDFSDTRILSLKPFIRFDHDTSYHWLMEQLGKPYDYRNVLRFVSRVPAAENEKFFCSELAHDYFLTGGVRLLKNIESRHVYPHMLLLSPLLDDWEGSL